MSKERLTKSVLTEALCVLFKTMTNDLLCKCTCKVWTLVNYLLYYLYLPIYLAFYTYVRTYISLFNSQNDESYII